MLFFSEKYLELSLLTANTHCSQQKVPDCNAEFWGIQYNIYTWFLGIKYSITFIWLLEQILCYAAHLPIALSLKHGRCQT